jgi:hypothetical protein
MSAFVLVFMVGMADSSGPKHASGEMQIRAASPAAQPLPEYVGIPEERITVAYRLFRRGVEPTVNLLLSVTETWRSVVRVSPSGVSVANDLYLGKGWAIRADLEAGACGVGPSIGVVWYPFEGVHVSLGFHLMRSAFVGGLAISP